MRQPAFQRSLGSAVIDAVSRFAPGILLLVVAVSFFCGLRGGSHKPLWFDEMFTLTVAMQPDWHRFAQAMVAEGNPPLNALLARGSMDLLGTTTYALRLPATLGVCAALVLLFVFVRRERDALSGLLAVVLLVCQPVWRYSYEARPYGVLLACVMAALVCWQSAVRAGEGGARVLRIAALCGLALAIAGAVFSHYIGALNVGVPLAFGEGYRTYRRRKVDGPLVAVMGFAFLPFLWIVPMMHRTERVILGRSLWDAGAIFAHFGAYLGGIASSWGLIFSNGLLLLLGVCVLLTWVPRRVDGTGEMAMKWSAAIQAPEASSFALAAALGTALLIPIAWVVMLSAKGYFFCRYGVASSLGVAMLGGLLVARHSVARNAQLLLALLFFSFLALKSMQVNLSFQSPGPALQYGAVYTTGGTLPVVIADPLIFPTVWWYAPAAEKRRVVYLTGLATNDPAFGRNILDADLTAERGLFPAAMPDAASFLRGHREFLLFDSSPDLLGKAALERAGCRVLASPAAVPSEAMYSVRCPAGST